MEILVALLLVFAVTCCLLQAFWVPARVSWGWLGFAAVIAAIFLVPALLIVGKGPH